MPTHRKSALPRARLPRACCSPLPVSNAQQIPHLAPKLWVEWARFEQRRVIHRLPARGPPLKHMHQKPVQTCLMQGCTLREMLWVCCHAQVASV